MILDHSLFFYKYKNGNIWMNKYIKHIVESFDFDSVNKQKKSINIYDEIAKIKHVIDSHDILTNEQY